MALDIIIIIGYIILFLLFFIVQLYIEYKNIYKIIKNNDSTDINIPLLVLLALIWPLYSILLVFSLIANWIDKTKDNFINSIREKHKRENPEEYL